MRLKGLLEPFENSVEFESIITDINNEKYPMGIYGVSESGRIYIVDNIFENINKSMVVVTQSDMEAKNVYEDLLLYSLTLSLVTTSLAIMSLIFFSIFFSFSPFLLAY